MIVNIVGDYWRCTVPPSISRHEVECRSSERARVSRSIADCLEGRQTLLYCSPPRQPPTGRYVAVSSAAAAAERARMTTLGTPLSVSATRVLLLGAREV